MRYADATELLYSLAPRGVQLGLARVEKALAQRGHPERACPAIVVAGTNGKGSVSSMVAAILRASGLRVGLYTSPHLHRLVERFQVDGRAVSERELARRVRDMSGWLRAEKTPELTFFEACTLLAFELFRDARCDVVVLEVGLGGRLDATNVVTPLVSVITRIALDHADRLGPTLKHIAREKAGVVKPGVPVVAAVREPVALGVIRARARRLNAPLLLLDRDFSAALEAGRFRARLGEQSLSGLRLALQGAYQADNLACALATVSVLRAQGKLPAKLDERAIRQGLMRVRWPGRLELRRGAPSYLFDAAHNPDACAALALELARLKREIAGSKRETARMVLLFGVLRDKEYEAMLGLLLPHVDGVVFTTPATPRAMPAHELAARFAGEVVDDPARAHARARKLAGKRGLVVVAGSIFVMAAVRAQVLGKRSDPTIAM